jgi:hypothetical protein
VTVDRYLFARSPASVFHMNPGEWVPVRFDGKRSAYFCCPTCRNVGGIRSHTIDAEGNVSPSIVCSATSPNTGKAGCAEKGFHEFAQLEGWAEIDWGITDQE